MSTGTVDVTDSGGSSPSCGVRVDTIGVRCPIPWGVIESLPDLFVRQVRKGEEIEHLTSGGRAWLPVGHGRAYIGADTRGDQPFARIEFNAPTVLHGHNADA